MAHIGLLVFHEVGHVNPTLKLARRLQARGHRVTYVGFPLIQSYVESQGFTFAPLSFDYLPFFVRLRRAGGAKGRLAHLRLRRAQARHVADLVRYLETGFLADVKRLAPDLLLIDLLWSFLSLLTVPSGVRTLQYATLLPYHRDPAVPMLSSPRVPEGGLGTRLRNEASWWRLRASRWGQRQLHRVLGTGWLDGANPEVMGLFRRLERGAAAGQSLTHDTLVLPVVDGPMLIFCPEAFDFPRARREHLHYVEPSIDEERKEPEFDWGWLKPEAPLLFSSLGSQIGRLDDAVRHRFFRTLLEVLAARPHVQAVLGGAADLPPGTARPPNVLTLEHAPQLGLLARASVALVAGGLATIKECIHHGVPMLVLPWAADDKQGNAARVVHHGLGLSLDIRTVGVSELGAAVDRLLHDAGPRARVRAMRERFRRLEAEAPSLRIIEQQLASP